MIEPLRQTIRRGLCDRISRGSSPEATEGEVERIGGFCERILSLPLSCRTRLLLGSNELEFNELPLQAFTFGIDHFILPKTCARVSLESADGASEF
eukprot:766233-Hanusia_phi.AAC.3